MAAVGVPALCGLLNQQILGAMAKPPANPAELGQFLHQLVTQLGQVMASCPPEIGQMAQGGFGSIGWDVVGNAPAPGSGPPDAASVMQMLQTLLERVAAPAGSGPPPAGPQNPPQPTPIGMPQAPMLCEQCQSNMHDPNGAVRGKMDDTIGKWYCFDCWALWDSGAPDTGFVDSNPAHPSLTRVILPSGVNQQAEANRSQQYQLAQNRLVQEAAASAESLRLQHEREQLRIGMEAEERKRQHEAELENNKQIEELRLKQEVANAALQLERDKQAMVRAHTCSHVAAAGVSD
jgi:hypothetical protein